MTRNKTAITRFAKYYVTLWTFKSQKQELKLKITWTKINFCKKTEESLIEIQRFWNEPFFLVNSLVALGRKFWVLKSNRTGPIFAHHAGALRAYLNPLLLV